jgi:hypothetical protein
MTNKFVLQPLLLIKNGAWAPGAANVPASHLHHTLPCGPASTSPSRRLLRITSHAADAPRTPPSPLHHTLPCGPTSTSPPVSSDWTDHRASSRADRDVSIHGEGLPHGERGLPQGGRQGQAQAPRPHRREELRPAHAPPRVRLLPLLILRPIPILFGNVETTTTPTPFPLADGTPQAPSMWPSKPGALRHHEEPLRAGARSQHQTGNCRQAARAHQGIYRGEGFDWTQESPKSTCLRLRFIPTNFYGFSVNFVPLHYI